MKSRKHDFPLLVENEAIVYLDTAATSQKPKAVIDSLVEYYTRFNAPVHRGSYSISEQSTSIYESAKEKIAGFIGAHDKSEIVFTKNATESLNLAAYLLLSNKNAGNIVLSITSHHSNFLPFLDIAGKNNIELRYLMCDQDGNIPNEELEKIDKETILVAIAHINNSLGVIHDIESISQRAKISGSMLVVDSSQSIAHTKTDVKKLGASMLAFSGHKMFGPQGIGVLFIDEKIKDSLPPMLLGGGMIEYVTLNGATYAPAPERFEAGSPDAAGAMGLEKAVDYILDLGIENIEEYEKSLTDFAYTRLKSVKGLKILGPAEGKPRGPVISFTLDGIHPHDLSSILDSQGVAIRAGHHCTQPLMKHLGIDSSARASFSVYNDVGDVDKLVDALDYARKVFRLE